MKIHVSELEGRALDYAVGLAKGFKLADTSESSKRIFFVVPDHGYMPLDDFFPSGDWGQCGPLIESAQLDIEWYGVDGYPIGWLATCENGTGERHDGHTVQLAICRAFVAESIGSEIEIPDELVK